MNTIQIKIFPFFFILTFLICDISYAQKKFDHYFNKLNSTPINDEEAILSEKIIVNSDKKNKLIISDFAQGKVFLFDQNGKLLESFGRTGRGPGEFEYLLSAKALNDTIYTVEFTGDLTFFDKENNLLKEDKIPLAPFSAATHLNTNQFLLLGKGLGENRIYLAHIYNSEKEIIEKSFFRAPPADAYGGVLNALGFLSISSYNPKKDIIASFISSYDTLYIHNTSGEIISKQKIPFQEFKSINNLKISRSIDDVSNTQMILSKISRIDKIIWIDNEHLLIQYYNRSSDIGYNDYIFSLSLINVDSNVLFEIENTPILHTFLESTNTFLFQNKDAEFFYAKLK